MATRFANRTLDPGTYTSASWATDFIAGQEVVVTASMSAVDLADPTLEIGIVVEGSNDGSTNWYPLNMYRWQGGITGKTGEVVPCQFAFRLGESVTAQRVRAVADLNRRVRIGVDVTVN